MDSVMQLEMNQILLLVFGLSSIVIAISLHEMMHAFTSYYLGDDTAKALGRVTINPLAHIDVFTTILLPLVLLLANLPPVGAAKPVPFNPSRLKFGDYGAALVALAGPLTNLALAILGGIGLQLAEGSTNLTNFYSVFVSVNVAFFVFNMLPIPPLDGSRVVYAIAPDPIRNLMEEIEKLGIFIMLLFFVFILPTISPFLISVNKWIINLVVL